jgi:group I intron endonuclease
MYIGSSVDLASRLFKHLGLFNNGSNLYLQRAIALYGLPSFVFIIVEFCTPDNLISREQFHLNWLFSLLSWAYNFCAIAGSCLGFKHSEETRAKMSTAKSGPNHPLYGRVAYNTLAVCVYTLNGKLVQSFSSFSNSCS